ncbi:MAG: hypothetical protein JXA11_06580, partial [Phycisphaerae bacterium]|nr:hypothetical protein [Phycisphaerae bacterium]
MPKRGISPQRLQNCHPERSAAESKDLIPIQQNKGRYSHLNFFESSHGRKPVDWSLAVSVCGAWRVFVDDGLFFSLWPRDR